MKTFLRLSILPYAFLLSVIALCAPVSVVAATNDFPSGVFIEKTARKSPTPFSEDERSALKKATAIEHEICENIYPAPKDDFECVAKMTEEVDRAFPGAKKKAEDLGLMDIPDGIFSVPLAKDIWRLNVRFIAACRGADFAKCMDKVYNTLPAAFDPHSGYMSPEENADMQQQATGSFSGIGLEVGGKVDEKDPVIAINPMEGSPAEKAGILPGDLIVGISKDGSESGMRPITSYATLNDTVKDIRGLKGTQVRLLIERPGETGQRIVVITRGDIDTQTVKFALLSEDGKRYGMIHIRSFMGQVCKKTEDAYTKLLAQAGGKLDGLIVSVERNPGGYMHEAHCTLDLFTDAKSFILQRNRTSIVPYQPCDKFFGFERCAGGIKSYPGDITKGLPILVMVNGGSASASEIFSAGMKHMGRAVIAGTPTFGKGSAQSLIPLPDGSILKITDEEYLVGTLEDWIPVQCLGITPDIIFDRGMDPKDRDGKRVSECGLERSIRSQGPMQNAPVHKPITEANPAHYAEGERMLEAYKKFATREQEKTKKQIELLKKLEESQKAKEKKK